MNIGLSLCSLNLFPSFLVPKKQSRYELELKNEKCMKTSAVILFWGVRFTESVYSEKFHLVQKNRPLYRMSVL